MPESHHPTQLVRDRHRTTDPGRRGSTLPAVLLAAVPRRLAIASLVYAGVFFVNEAWGWIYTYFFAPELFAWTARRAAGPIFMALALGIYGLSRRKSLTPQHLGLVGLTFEVVGTFGIAIAAIVPNFAPLESRTFVGIPWTCTWLCVYPLLVPMSPRNAAVAGLLATATVPLAVLLQREVLATSPVSPMYWQHWMMITFPNLICAGMGTYAARLAFHLGREVTKARELGSYRLGERLGTGGMGEVWRANHRMLRRPAAIKLVRPDRLGAVTDPRGLLRRFEREAQVTASLQSAHTIRLYDFGITEEDTFYYVMEFLEGIDLETMVDRFGPVSPARAIHWLRQACASLAEAHESGLIHRDIKPANLYACRNGLEVDFLKLLDFGLVKETPHAGEQATHMTAEHAATGTPAYMAPEMALGKQGLDGRADLYSLGCVAYWLLTGRTVFEGDTPMEMIVAHVQKEPVRLAQRSELEIPDDLESVVMDCLRKTPDERPPDAMALRARLDACRDAARWSSDMAEQWWRRHLPEIAPRTASTPTDPTTMKGSES